MNAPIATTAGFRFPGDVAELAASRHAGEQLLALRAALDEQFPTAHAIDVRLESDPEIREDSHIVFEVQVARADLLDFAAAKRSWHEEVFRRCPPALVCFFRLTLVRTA